MSSKVSSPHLDICWFEERDCDPNELRALVATETELVDYPHADQVVQNVLVYDVRAIREATARVAAVGGPTLRGRRALQAELVRALQDGPGIVVLSGAFDEDVVDRASGVFEAMIAEQRAGGRSVGDHFAASGANDRVWNALEKLAVRDPAVFVDYYANDALALISTAWLGPAYQVTSQVNVVNPGGRAQSMHRDYHLGFMTNESVSRYPAHVHQMSPLLTLQGAVAHCDMPVETGPTLYLPHSQKLAAGYLAWRLPEFQQLFADSHVQLPLRKGDAVFFNPALFHAAGSNTSADVKRMANLLQVSSAFGRAMESVDRGRVVSAIFPTLLDRVGRGDEAGARNALGAAAEGYPFPADLDLEPPVAGLAPPSQADLAWEAVRERWPQERLDEALRGHAARRSGRV